MTLIEPDRRTRHREVLNQPPPLEGHNLYPRTARSWRPCAARAPTWAEDRLLAMGDEAGSASRSSGAGSRTRTRRC